MKRCFGWHAWTPWICYEETGLAMMTGWLSPKDERGKQVGYTETRQTRSCRRCGKTQDEYVKAGPLPGSRSQLQQNQRVGP